MAQLIANSRVHPGPGGAIVTEPLAAAPPPGFVSRLVGFVYDHLSGSLAATEDESGLVGSGAGRGPGHAGLAAGCARGAAADQRLARPGGGALHPARRRGQLLITVAEPINRGQQNVGTVLLTREANEVDRAVLAVRISILGLFALALALTVLRLVLPGAHHRQPDFAAGRARRR